MADKQDGSPDASIPDLKKAQEKAKEAPPTWSTGAPVVRAAAAAAPASVVLRAPAEKPAWHERYPMPVKLAGLAGLMLLGAGVFYVTAMHDGDASAGGGSLMGGINSSVKVHAFRGRESMAFVKGGDDTTAANKGKMRLDLIKGGAEAAPGEAAGATKDGAPGGLDGGEPMATGDGPSGGRAGTAGGPGSGMASKGGDGSGGNGSGAGGGGFGPRLNAAGGVKFQGMRHVSGTAGFRNITGRRGAGGKSGQTIGSSANSANGADGRGGSGTNGAAFSGAGGVGSNGGVGGGRSAADEVSAGGGSGGGGGGGGGGLGDVKDPGLTPEQTMAQVTDLMNQAKDKREEAGKQKKYAEALAVAGQWPQAHYHYDKSEKASGEAKDLEGQAQAKLAAMNAQADAVKAAAQKPPDKGKPITVSP